MGPTVPFQVESNKTLVGHQPQKNTKTPVEHKKLMVPQELSILDRMPSVDDDAVFVLHCSTPQVLRDVDNK